MTTLNKTIYKVESPIYISHVGYNDPVDGYDISLEGRSEVDGLNSRVADDIQEIGPRGLAEYLSDYNAPLHKIIEKIHVTVTSKGAETIVEANRALSKEEIGKLEDYISGQFSDGWGEGFEQQSLDRYTNEYEEYDEEEEDYYMEEEEVDIYAHFWKSDNFSIKTTKVS